MGTFIDLTGKRFGRLTVIRRIPNEGKKFILWECICDCGNVTKVRGSNLRNGHTTSCGCYRMETTAAHVLSKDTIRKENKRLFSIWKGMNRRCKNKEYTKYKNYGGRGISVCEEWTGESGFSNFVKWANENGYAENLTIDRIDNGGNYCPANCRWATKSQQVNNTRRNRRFEYKGETKTLAQWADAYGMTQCELKRRIDYIGLPIEVALVKEGTPRINYNGKNTTISYLARKYGIPYKTFLYEVIIDGKSAEEIINKHTKCLKT